MRNWKVVKVEMRLRRQELGAWENEGGAMTEEEFDHEWDLLYGTAQDPPDEEINAQYNQLQLEADLRWRKAYGA